jgi:anti-anti-sigma factor
MEIEVSTHGIYRLIRVHDPISAIDDLTEIRSLIAFYLNQGDRLFSLQFTNVSYLYSGAISVLVSCYKLVHERQGELSIVDPHPTLLMLLRQMGLDMLMNIYDSLDDLPDDSRQIEELQINYRDSGAISDRVPI